VSGIRGFGTESFRKIEDGTAHTLLVGESTTRTNMAYRTLWAYSHAFYSLSALTPQKRTLQGDYDRCRARRQPGGAGPCRRGWGSFHADGLHFLCCDGSVHFFDAETDPELLAALATVAGGEQAELPGD
jgi:hypothetical protein